VIIGISALVLSDFLALGHSPLERLSVRAEPGDPGLRLSIQAAFPETPQAGEAVVWYLGHCGFAVRTQNHLLIFDYQELRDGARPKARPAKLSLEEGWIDPKEIKDLAVCVFVSHSHNDHFDPVIFNWQKAIPDIAYYFGWKAADDPAFHYLVGPQAELKSDGLEIATINSHHSGVPEVAWLVKVDGLVIYHNGDCRPDDPTSEHDFLKTKTDVIDLAFVFPVYEDGQKYTAQTTDFFRKFRVRAAFPMHAQAGDAMYLGFKKAFQARFPGLSIHVPMKMGQKFVLQDIFGALRKGDIQTVKALVAKDPKVVNEKDTRGGTPLHFASNAGNREIVAFLIAKGAEQRLSQNSAKTGCCEYILSVIRCIINNIFCNDV
jgi:L-ascorbate metabolism protein UlaG (beta-lactamase superfamily)